MQLPPAALGCHIGVTGGKVQPCPPGAPSLTAPALPELALSHKALTPGPGCPWHLMIMAASAGSSQCFLVSSCPYKASLPALLPCCSASCLWSENHKAFWNKMSKGWKWNCPGSSQEQAVASQICCSLFLTPVRCYFFLPLF